MATGLNVPSVLPGPAAAPSGASEGSPSLSVRRRRLRHPAATGVLLGIGVLLLFAIIWIGLICILFLMPIAPAGIPWNDAFDWNVVNYAPITVGGVLLAVGLWWLASARTWFKGPVVQGTEEELEQIEAQYEQPAGSAAPTSA